VAREGWWLIAASAFVTVYLALLGLTMVALFFLAVTIFLGCFFRDPYREIPVGENLAVSPADGKIVEVRVVSKSEFAHEDMLKISVFMSIFNVHVNRMPTEGTVTGVAYHPGRYFAANLNKASSHNERNAVSLEISGGRRVVVVQVAGLIARRIVCKVRQGDRLRRGDRFGMICFGSRLDVYLPPDTQPVVAVGDKVWAGTSVLGRLA